MLSVPLGVHIDLGAAPNFSAVTSSASATATTTPGVVVTTAALNADDGAAVSLIGTPLAQNVDYLFVGLGGNNSISTDTSTIIDILIDPAGGTTWAPLISSLPAGFIPATTFLTPYQRQFTFPVKIPAGSTLGCKGRNITASTRAVSVDVLAYSSLRPRWAGSVVDVLGDVRASSGGTRVLPNASADTFGSWISIGAPTSREYGMVHVSCQGDDGGMVAQGYIAQLGIASAQVGHSMSYITSASELVGPISPTGLLQRTIPVGTQLQLRAKASGAAGDACQFVIHGIA